MFNRIKEGDTVVSKKFGTPGKVERLSYDKIFVQSVGNLSGELRGSRCDKAAFRPGRNGEEYYCGLCRSMMPLSSGLHPHT